MNNASQVYVLFMYTLDHDDFFIGFIRRLTLHIDASTEHLRLRSCQRAFIDWSVNRICVMAEHNLS